MKYYYKFVPIVLVIALVACYKDEPMTEPGKEGPSQIKRCLRNGDDVKMIVDPDLKYKITPNKAVEIARKKIFEISDGATTRSLLYVGEPMVNPIISTRLTRSAASTDTLLYAINFPDSGGFALVSFDDRDEEVLMYSEKGNFNITDTIGDAAMKFHVDMIMAYQEHKLQKIREAEAKGEKYMGMYVPVEGESDFEDIPTELTEDNSSQPLTRAGMPGSGLPGGGTGMPGMPGLPGYGCIPSHYKSLGWSGNPTAISIAQQKHAGSNCYGPKVAPPDFNPERPGGVIGVPEEGDCPYPPYCNPPIMSLDQFYQHYGAVLRSTYTRQSIQEIKPMLTTEWDQRDPLNMFCYITIPPFNITRKVVAGCGPIAAAQIMAYHRKPSYLHYTADDGEIDYYAPMDSLRKYKDNVDIPEKYRLPAAAWVKRLGVDMNAVYSVMGTGVVGLVRNAEDLLAVFEKWGYRYRYGRVSLPYGSNIYNIRRSIQDGLPVLIWGFEGKPGKPDYTTGHIWVLDGLKTTETWTYDRDLYFNENGDLTEMRTQSYHKTVREIHSNLGWSQNNLHWVAEGCYEFAGDAYTGQLEVICGISPE